MTKEELFRLREKEAQGMPWLNYFITTTRGGILRACRCFVTSATKLPDKPLGDIIDHRTQLKINYYKCNLFSSLN